MFIVSPTTVWNPAFGFEMLIRRGLDAGLQDAFLRSGTCAAERRTRGDAILYGPQFPLLPVRERIGLAGHHVPHVTLRHSARMAAMAAQLGPAFDERRFNRAADAIANDAILAAGHADGLVGNAHHVAVPPPGRRRLVRRGSRPRGRPAPGRVLLPGA